MRRPGKLLFRAAAPILLATLAIVSMDVEIALATDLPIYGGLGGNTFRAECPKGSYLVGLAGKTGSWVDRIAPVCAPWLRGSQTFGPPKVGPSFGMSSGGQERHEICWNEFVGSIYVIQSWKIDVLRSDNHYVQRIRTYCASVPPSAKSMGFYFGNKAPYDQNVSFDPFGTRPPEQACPAGEVATGFRIRTGQFVDAIGLICRPVPAGVGAPATKVDPRIMMPRTDLLEIVKPLAGDKVPHGQLFIFAAPPKVGRTDVVELELRYLDAPANLQHAYPYTTFLSVSMVQLLDGYPVPERVTGGYVGHWQVRARSSMNTVPGPWSLPVQFRMVQAQPPPPMAQTLRPNAPITQTPAPGSSMMQVPAPSSAPSPMRRSPSMIMPRGVEEKGGAPTNETVGQPGDSRQYP
jgi:hypothetical protein